MNRLNDFVTALWQSLLSLLKIVIQSRLCTHIPKHSGIGTELVVLGNGPSLRDTIDHSMPFLSSRTMLAVNFAACADDFFSLRPQYYVLADPHFFNATDQPNVQRLWQVLGSEVTWTMTLLVPHRFASIMRSKALAAGNSHLTVAFYNTTPVEGFAWFENAAYKANLGMPRPRNVLIPSIMLGMALGFSTIYVAGADHSWTRTLSVDDDNRVVSIQPHFYKEDEREEKRVRKDYMNYPLHQILQSFYVAFRSYFTIARYARHRGVKIFNITPGSFIDAFPRLKV
ncbi:MAG: hypothetical protein ACI4UN_09255 [Muribaculaceae bacterium]